VGKENDASGLPCKGKLPGEFTPGLLPLLE
jgi:hypothetical protein